MKNIGILRAMKLCRDYDRAEPEKRQEIREERLRRIIKHARQNSPYYSRLWRDLPEDAALSDLPPTDKKTLMANWNDWVCDRQLTLEAAELFMADTDNIGRKLMGRYLVLTTSGSTGSPLVAVYDKSANNIMGGIAAGRSYARKEDLRAFIRRGGRSIGVFADEGFYLGNSSIRSRLRSMPWKKRQLAVASALRPLGETVEQLNRFQPAMLGGYPSHLELLAAEAEAGRLNIAPVIVMTGGEQLTDAVRRRLSEVFGCYVQTSYSCTEGGTVACECTKQHLHINDDWLIAEPVDAEGRPVPEGTRSEKIYLTNLYNYTQPYIRYELSDRVILHREPCGCGNPSPWLELEGRADDVTTFTGTDGQSLRLAPLALSSTLKETPGLRRFQLLVYPDNRAELRVETQSGFGRAAVFEAAKDRLTRYLAAQGIGSVALTLSETPPRQDPGSGKFKHILNRQSTSPDA